jgi:D-glycero-D-manno-heptose 1,7-bisphosphate phosphatase
MKAIFIDRDGVINKDPGGWTKHGYVTDPKDLHFLPGSLQALKLLKTHGFSVIIISNQGGVNKGYFTKDQLNKVNDTMLNAVKLAGGEILDVFYCVHKDDDNCLCRKPKTGLLEMAAKKYKINLKNIFFIGDSFRDITAGKIVGARTIFVLSGKHKEEEMKTWRDKPHHVFDDLLGAVKWILEKEKRRSSRAFSREKEGRAIKSAEEQE